MRQLTPRLQRAQQTWYELSQLAERVRGTISLADARVKSATSVPAEERRGREPEDMEREAARIREQEAELEAALEAAEHALEDTVAHRAELERELAVEERRLKDVARAIADRREGLARLNGQVNAARSRAASAQAEIDRLASARDEAQERAVAAQEEYEQLKAEVDGLDAGDAELTEQHEAAKRALSDAESALTAAREAATAAERRRAATQARHEALALGLRRKDGTGALLGAKDRLSGLLGPAAELLSVTPGFEVALAAAFGAAADAIAVTTPASAADAIRLLRKQDAGRAALLLAGAPEERDQEARPGRADGAGRDAYAPTSDVRAGAGVEANAASGDAHAGAGANPYGAPSDVGADAYAPSNDTRAGADVEAHAPTGDARQGTRAEAHAPTSAVPRQARHDGPPHAADLVRGPAELMPAVRRLLRGIVVVGTLEDAEDLVYARPELTAVTAEGDLLGAHFAHGGSAGAPSLLEVQASVDEAAAELEELAVRCEELTEAQHLATELRGERAALVEELGERRRAAEREKSSVAQQLGRLAGQARGLPERPSGARPPPRGRRRRSTRPSRRPRSWPSGSPWPRRCPSRRSPTPPCATGSPPTAPTHGRPRWRPGSRCVRTRSGSRDSPGGPTDSTGPHGRNVRHARVPSSGGPGCGTKRRSPRPSPPAPASCSRMSRSR